MRRQDGAQRDAEAVVHTARFYGLTFEEFVQMAHELWLASLHDEARRMQKP